MHEEERASLPYCYLPLGRSGRFLLPLVGILLYLRGVVKGN